ncbi:MAG TPA: hypothetical protein VGR09_00865, partial [Gemmatimonadales bacterium]|nr:hypothetical protein [Gemmatimonadales bacterium]
TVDERRLIGRLSGILRIADGLDRTHSQAVTGLKVRALRNRLRLNIEAGASPEVECADAQRKSDLFRKAFDTKVEMVWRRSRARRRVAGAPRGLQLHVAAAS